MSEKPTVIHINRYYRPYAFPKTIFSNRGVTVMYRLDYNDRTFLAKWSICNGDNFSKVTGIQYAQACETPIIGPITPGMKLNEMLMTQLDQVLKTRDPIYSKKALRNLTLLASELLESM